MKRERSPFRHARPKGGTIMLQPRGRIVAAGSWGWGVLLLFGIVLAGRCPAALGWGGQHNEASVLAAGMSPEPFRSHATMCVWACYPDAMQDHAVGHGQNGYPLRLFTREAIAALRADDLPKAMFLASAATHYLTDRVCVAHATRAWYHGALSKDPWTQFLPRKYQDVFVAHGKRTVYYPHLKGTTSDMCLFLPEPECNVEKWREFQGSLNAYFDSMPSVRKYVTPEMLRRPDDWTFNDFDQYARWYGFFIALDMLDPASLKNPPLRLRDARGMRAVCVEELINGTAQCAAYYGYLSTAAKARVEPSLDACLPGFDKFLALAEREPVVAISATAPWPVERAAHVVAMELLRATGRLAQTKARPAPVRPLADYVVRLSADGDLKPLGGRSAVVLLTPDDERLARALKAPEVPGGASGVIAASRSDGSASPATVVLRGVSRQDTLYLVDYLLDLAWAPRHGPWPAQRAVEVLQDVWSGWKLIVDLRELRGQEAVAYARKLPYSHVATRSQDTAKYGAGMKQGLQPAAGEDEWWRHFLLEIPLPDGRRATTMIEQGADYSRLLPRVGK
jgi:hypothetical protein